MDSKCVVAKGELLCERSGMTQQGRVTVTSQRGDWYQYPSWYDILHSPGTAREVDGLARIAQRFGGVSSVARRDPELWAGRWIEPGCGSGRYLRVAAGRGVRVTGFDASEPMIAYAKRSFQRRGLSGDFFVADMTDFRVRTKADFAFCMYSTIRHLMNDRAVLDHLACMARALARGGVYAVGMDVVGSMPQQVSEDVWHGRRGRCSVTQAVQYLPGRTGTRREHVVSHLHIRTPRRSHHLDSTYDLRTYSTEQWAKLVGQSALRMVSVCDEAGEKLERQDSRFGGYRVFVLGLPQARR